MPLSAEKRVLDMLTQLWVLPVDIRLSAHMSKLHFTNKAYSYVGDMPVFDMADRPISDWNLVFKWVFDKVVALTALILLSPVMLATAIAIKLESKGPVFFRQKRHGFNNELIEIYKFRSMCTDMLDASAAKLVTKDDPRVTKVGKFIRKTSIDELPQLFNVLKGELSIVGPAPACAAGQGRQQALLRGRRRLFRPPQGQAGHDRLGADQRLARRDRHDRQDHAAREPRPLLHRELVDPARPLHRADDAGLAGLQERERLLSDGLRRWRPLDGRRRRARPCVQCAARAMRCSTCIVGVLDLLRRLGASPSRRPTS